MKQNNFFNFFSEDLSCILKRLDKDFIEDIEEIRLRANKPIVVKKNFGNWYLEKGGVPAKSINSSLLVTTQNDILKTFAVMSENSIYAFLDEIKNGFITLKGGHRVGIAGRIVLDGANIKNIKDISGLNIRFAREIQGCSLNIIKYIIKSYDEIYNTLIISPPQCGKTTIIRDLARLIGEGQMLSRPLKISIIDERSEIAACYKGIPQNNVGLHTDVLDACPKVLGMKIALRSMSPEVIITDEIGNENDRDAIINIINAGVKLITTVHGYNISELKSRREILNIMNEGVFERYIVISNSKGPGTLEEVFDGNTMKKLYWREKNVS